MIYGATFGFYESVHRRQINLFPLSAYQIQHNWIRRMEQTQRGEVATHSHKTVLRVSQCWRAEHPTSEDRRSSWCVVRTIQLMEIWLPFFATVRLVRFRRSNDQPTENWFHTMKREIWSPNWHVHTYCLNPNTNPFILQLKCNPPSNWPRIQFNGLNRKFLVFFHSHSKSCVPSSCVSSSEWKGFQWIKYTRVSYTTYTHTHHKAWNVYKVTWRQPVTRKRNK